MILAWAFALDGVGYLAVGRGATGRLRRLAVVAAGADFATAIGLVVLRHAADRLLAIAAALRLFGIAWAMAATPVHTVGDAVGTVLDDLGLSDRPEAAELLERIALEERVRASTDRRWTVAFLVTLFAIHVARLQPDGSLLGYSAPASPCWATWRWRCCLPCRIAPLSLSLRLDALDRAEGLALVPAPATRHNAAAASPGGRLARYRLRMAFRLREARFSIPAASGGAWPPACPRPRWWRPRCPCGA